MRWLDVVLLLVVAGLALAGPWMALQELGQQREDWARFELTGVMPEPSVDHRDVWRVLLPAAVVLVDVLVTLMLVRINARKHVRSVARRPGLLLLGGLCLLDLAYFFDWGYMMDAHYLLRAPYVFVLYPVAAALVGGSVHTLAVLEDTFAPLETPGGAAGEPDALDA